MSSSYLFILDLDGTLVDSLADLTASVNVVRCEFSLAPLQPQEVKLLVGQGARSLVQRALPGWDAAAIESGLATFLAHNEAHLFDRTRLYPGVTETLAELSGQGHTLALLSNKNEGLCRQLLDLCGIGVRFAAVVGGDSLPWRKPSPQPLRHIMAMLAKQSEETIMVGDSINDIAAGRDAGVMTVGCRYGYGTPAEVAEAAVGIDAFSELLQLPLPGYRSER